MRILLSPGFFLFGTAVDSEADVEADAVSRGETGPLLTPASTASPAQTSRTLLSTSTNRLPPVHLTYSTFKLSGSLSGGLSTIKKQRWQLTYRCKRGLTNLINLGWYRSRYLESENGIVALVKIRLNGYSRAEALVFSLAAPSFAATSVEGSCKGAPLDDELKGKASSLIGSPRAAAMSARSVRVTSWKSGSERIC